MQSLTSFITRHSREFALSIFLTHASICLQAQPASGVSAGRDIWQVPLSHNLMPHFEQANGRKVLYVDGRPFTVLAVEIPWWDLIYGRYKQTETAYDNLYPAAEKMGLNALKVPIKWSMVEPQKGVYDFSYVDHAKSMVNIGEIVHTFLRFHHRPLNGNFQRIESHFFRGRIEIVVRSFGLLISAVYEVPPRDLDCKDSEWPSIHIQDLASVRLFEVRHQVIADWNLPHIGFVCPTGSL